MAKVLGNTPAVCKRYYIHARVIEGFAAGELTKLPAVRGKLPGLTRTEMALARFLDEPRRGAVSSPWRAAKRRVALQ